MPLITCPTGPKLPKLPDYQCSHIADAKYRFIGNKCYKNGALFGEVIKDDGGKKTVKVISENKYMNGQEVVFHVF